MESWVWGSGVMQANRRADGNIRPTTLLPRIWGGPRQVQVEAGKMFFVGGLY